MISIRNLKKNYDGEGAVTTALEDISFDITTGEFVAIMGPSGSGKSTLLHILSFLDRPTSGSYAFQGKRMQDLSDEELARIRNEEMGFIFQSFNLLARQTVYENVEIPLIYNANIPPELREARVRAAVAAVGLDDKLYEEAGKLSGVQKQRVAIARALVNQPNVIFADEPTGNLDSASGAQIMEILARLNESGHTIILVTHETYTSEFAKRAIHIKDGRIHSDGPLTRRRTSKSDFIK